MKRLLRLFWEVFRIALFVVGGASAIIVVADEVFGRRLKWLREGELLEHLPVFQMVPGLIAGNSAIYVGLKTAGRLGAAVALLAVALPSYLIFLGVSCGYSLLPVGNPWVEGALLGLRSAITGVVFATLLRGWRKSVVGVYGYATVVLATALLVAVNANVALVLLAAMGAGIVWKFCGGATPDHDDASAGLELPPLSRGRQLLVWGGGLLALAAVSWFYGEVFWSFVKFGLLGFGGGYVLVPMYMQQFVGASAPQLQLPMEEFANLMALTQATPGPVSVNAATFFGYRMGGIAGAAVATAALLLPSLFLLTAALTGLARWKRSRFVQGLLWGVKPATNALILKAGIAFAGMSVWSWAPGQAFVFRPCSLVLAVFAGAMLLKKRLSVMATIFLCAAAGALCWGGLIG